MNTNIIKTECLITHIQHVSRSSLSPRFIHHAEGRAWDAFCYILRGRCHYTFSDGTQFTATQGCVIYLAKDSLYDMQIEEGPYEGIFSDFLFQSDHPRQSTLVSLPDPAETENRFYRLYGRYTARSAGYVSECLSLLYRIYATLQAIGAPQYLPSVARHTVDEIRAYIVEHYNDEALSVHALAKRAGISEVHLRKLFHASLGTTPVAFILDTRLSHAKELMRYTDLPLEEIALQCGFSSLSYFCRVFKQQTDLTPGQFRLRFPPAP